MGATCYISLRINLLAGLKPTCGVITAIFSTHQFPIDFAQFNIAVIINPTTSAVPASTTKTNLKDAHHRVNSPFRCNTNPRTNPTKRLLHPLKPKRLDSPPSNNRTPPFRVPK